jgi:hypothetical protein
MRHGLENTGRFRIRKVIREHEEVGVSGELLDRVPIIRVQLHVVKGVVHIVSSAKMQEGSGALGNSVGTDQTVSERVGHIPGILEVAVQTHGPLGERPFAIGKGRFADNGAPRKLSAQRREVRENRREVVL